MAVNYAAATEWHQDGCVETLNRGAAQAARKRERGAKPLAPGSALLVWP